MRPVYLQKQSAIILLYKPGRDEIPFSLNYSTIVNVGNIDWRNERPSTGYYDDLVDNSMSVELRFLLQLVQDKVHNSVELLPFESNNVTYSIRASHLHDTEFRKYLQTTGLASNYISSASKLGSNLKRYEIDRFTVKRRRDGFVYHFDVQTCLNWFTRNDYLEIDTELPDLLSSGDPIIELCST